MVIVLNSKNYPTKTRDIWWYNICSPDRRLKRDTKINLNLYNETNRIKIGSIILSLNQDDWYRRILKASRHIYNGVEIVKVHIAREKRSAQYRIYFGRKDDGVFPVNIQCL